MSDSVRVPAWALLITPLAMLASFLLGLALARLPTLPEPQGTALHHVHREILRSYVDEVDPQVLLDRAIGAMAHLDDYSQYVPPSALAEFVEETTGTYEGIGMVSHLADDGLFVRFPFPDGPADRAGLLPGDRIVAIDTFDLDPLTTAERQQAMIERVRGAAGSTVTLTVQRGDRKERVAVVRGPVQKASVKWASQLGDDGMLYVHLSDFHPGCARELERVIAALLANGGRRGLVLDLRFDGGGNLDECVAIARLFLPRGNIVTMRRRGAEVVERHDASGPCPFADLPLVLLVNEASASASEVLAGALQDHGRAAVVGMPTYGKGFVNTLFRWEGLDFRLKLTTAHYYTPNGRDLDRGRQRRSNGDAANGDGKAAQPAGGITPDRLVAIDGKLRERIHQALAEQPFAERHRTQLAEWSAARSLRLPGILGADEDPQLAAALAVLRERVATAGNGEGPGAGK